MSFRLIGPRLGANIATANKVGLCQGNNIVTVNKVLFDGFSDKRNPSGDIGSLRVIVLNSFGTYSKEFGCGVTNSCCQATRCQRGKVKNQCQTEVT